MRVDEYGQKDSILYRVHVTTKSALQQNTVDDSGSLRLGIQIFTWMDWMYVGCLYTPIVPSTYYHV
jgi:hypothetical protein